MRRLQMLLSPELYARLDAYREKIGEPTLAGIIRRALADFLDRNNS